VVLQMLKAFGEALFCPGCARGNVAIGNVGEPESAKLIPMMPMPVGKNGRDYAR
jgi:hypothetical protein